MKKINRKILMMIITYIVISFTPKSNYEKNVSINDNYKYNREEFFGTYRNGKVYIGSKNYIYSIIDENTNNVYIIDSRKDSNPDMLICNSFKINNANDINDILELLIEYENIYPSNWDRTIESMKKEWQLHNFLYNLGLYESSTESVDLDNEDEDYYNSNVLNKILNQ